KPENVFVTRERLLKILDFGLAKAATPAEGVNTEPGVLMGTARYMSPEQIRGEPLDARSDIFALGIVLYEMLGGHPPFEARSQVETMNAILHDDPADLDGVPETIDAIVRRCLEKEPASRFSSARDLSYALDAAARTSASTKAPVKRTTAPIRRPWARITIMTAILAALIIAAMLTRGHFDRDAPEPPRLSPLTYSGRDNSPAASPDGKLVAFVSTRDDRARIWLKQLADGTEVAITTGPDDGSPRFTHDGAAILFTRVERGVSAIHRVAVVGGEPRKLIDDAFDGDASPDGRRIAFIRSRHDRASRVCIATIDGGDVRELVASSGDDYRAPRWSPDGRSLAVTRHPRRTLGSSVLIFDLESGEHRELTREDAHGTISGVAWTDDGDAVIYAEREALTRAAAVIRHQTSGASRVLLRNPHGAADTIDLIAPGRIVLSEDVTRQNLEEIALAGNAPPRWLSRGMSADRQPAYARDGRSVIFTSDRGGNVDLWELDLGTGSLRRLTDHAAIDWDPHANGDQLFWSSNRGGHYEVWTASIDGANPRQLTKDGVDAENPTLPASGDWVYYDSSNPRHDGLFRMPRAGGEAKLVVAGETIHPIVSADGAFVVYQRPEAEGTSSIDVVRVADGKVFNLAARIGGIVALRAHWIGTTHTIAFRTREGIVAQDFVPGVETASSRRQLTADAETFVISPDGTRAILSFVDEGSALMIATY
ncbi:MAG TPA: protein kinase, partial [Thermoanaerobaculia bacterium]|nr:protein kinase [Thermoanaerobaculia bacterium]